MRGYDLSQDHAHCEREYENHEIDDMMDRRECNDAGSKVNVSNRVPLEQRRMRVEMRMLVVRRDENMKTQ